MQTDLTARRRLFITSYRKYQAADRAWTLALVKAAEIVPDAVGKGYWRLGNAKSRLRKLYVERDRALQRMMAARQKLSEAKLRKAQQVYNSHRVIMLVDMRGANI